MPLLYCELTLVQTCKHGFFDNILAKIHDSHIYTFPTGNIYALKGLQVGMNRTCCAERQHFNPYTIISHAWIAATLSNTAEAVALQQFLFLNSF